MRRQGYLFHLYIIVALLLGTAMPLQHAVADGGQGFWTSTCRGKALFVPAPLTDPAEQHHRCLICVAESNDEPALYHDAASHLAPAQATPRSYGPLALLPRCSSARYSIRAPPVSAHLS